MHILATDLTIKILFVKLFVILAAHVLDVKIERRESPTRHRL